VEGPGARARAGGTPALSSRGARAPVGPVHHLEGLLACPHRPPCSACPRFGERGIAGAAQGALDELARAHGLPAVEVVSGSNAGFRLRARLAIRGRLGSPKIGLFELGTHRVVHVPNCRVQHPLINRVASVVRRALVEARVTSYSDKAHTGVARYLQVVVERASQSAQVVIVAHSATAQPLTECCALIRERLGGDLHSLWFNSNLEHANAILGPAFEKLCGPESVIESFGFGGASVHYPPGAFGQSNLDIAQRIIEHLRAGIPEGARVAEFYAGVGAIGLSVLDRVSEMRFNEVSPHSLHGLALGIAGLGPADRAKVSVVAGTAATALEAADRSQIVIVDPPRKGLDRELAAYLRERPPDRLLYVSCGLPSLLEDIARLTSAGTMRLAELKAFNLMPFTEHVETVAMLERR
jgi:23S rRNA (uracil1939-C5)-methyltransferase